jgi:tRNA/rRNA methyltransferase
MLPARAPAVILVAPQMGENIGMVARAMANMGMRDLRLVAPRDGWPNEKAVAAASGANDILTRARLFDALEPAVADCHLLYATTAVDYAQAKRVIGPREAAAAARAQLAAGRTVGVLFGRERIGLLAEEIARASAVVTLPVDPAFASLNIAQAVLLMGYEWLLAQGDEGELMPFVTDLGSPPATRGEVLGLMDHLERELDAAGFFTPVHKKETMTRNLLNILNRRDLTQQDVRTLHGVVTQLAKGRAGAGAR